MKGMIILLRLWLGLKGKEGMDGWEGREGGLVMILGHR